MRAPESREVKRAVIIVEMEDGGTAMFYADNFQDGDLSVTTDTPTEHVPWSVGPRVTGPTRTAIHVEGASGYAATDVMPAMAKHVLDAVKAGLRP